LTGRELMGLPFRCPHTPAQVGFGVNGQIGPERDFILPAMILIDDTKWADQPAANSCSAGAGARGGRRSKLDVQAAIAAVRGAVPATRGVGFGGVQHFP